MPSLHSVVKHPRVKGRGDAQQLYSELCNRKERGRSPQWELRNGQARSRNNDPAR